MKTTIIFPSKVISIGIVSIMLAACGEETDHIPPAMNQPPAVTPPVTSIPATPIGPGISSIPSTPL